MGKHRKKEIGLIIRKQKSGKLYEDEVMRMTSSFCFPGDCPLRLLQYSKPPCVPSACSSGSFALPLSAAFNGVICREVCHTHSSYYEMHLTNSTQSYGN